VDKLNLQFVSNHWGWFLFALLVLAAGRYILFAGTAYLSCYRFWFNVFRKYKIQPSKPKQKQLFYELSYSFSTIAVFSATGFAGYLLYVNGYSKIYFTVNERGWLYFLFSILLMIIIHDTYFYWTHRLLHTRWFFKKIHYVHHRSVNPTPLAAYAFHPLEALIESLVVLPIITIIPVHIGALLLFTFFVLFMNVMGHLGFEFMSDRMRKSRIGKLFTSSTHHNLHHQKCNKNFAYYFSFWDTIMKTFND
jgi:sterol desaturase/sphingolipid hydroxylase (fatty acid hydroxylase superfamily)